jgi:hypothetical protein
MRFATYAAFMASLTGLGLFFVGGVRGVESWVWFFAAAVLGVLGAVWGARSALAALPALSDTDRSSSAGREADPGSGSVRPESSSELPPEPDEVDYLTALRHEFRTPLNAVLGFSDVLLSGIDGEVNESQREDLEIIRASGIRLRILLDSALDLSQLAGGELRVGAERTDIRELVARVAVEAGQLWSNKRSAACILPDEPCFADADEARLRRSILVLADFLASDYRDALISLKLARSGEHLAIEITAEPSDRLTMEALPTPAEVLASEDATEIRRWPVAVTSEVIARHRGSLYHGDQPSRFRIRIPVGSTR